MKEIDNSIENFPIVAKVVNRETVVLNKGKIDGITMGKEFCIFLRGEEIYDPITKEPLGYIEISKGCGRITQLQDRISVLTAGSGAQVMASYFQSQIGGKKLMFNDVAIGDYAKPR